METPTDITVAFGRIMYQLPPESVSERPLHSPKVTAWCAMSASGVVGPFFRVPEWIRHHCWSTRLRSNTGGVLATPARSRKATQYPERLILVPARWGSFILKRHLVISFRLISFNSGTFHWFWIGTFHFDRFTPTWHEASQIILGHWLDNRHWISITVG